MLALADAFIVVIAGLLANFPIPIYAARIGRPELFAFLSTCVVCCLAALLLTVLGVVAGLMPASRAMQIKPVDAMRDE